MVEGHVQVEWCGISSPWLWAVAQSEGAELGGGNQKQHFIFTSVSTPFPHVLAGSVGNCRKGGYMLPSQANYACCVGFGG